MVELGLYRFLACLILWSFNIFKPQYHMRIIFGKSLYISLYLMSLLIATSSTDVLAYRWGPFDWLRVHDTVEGSKRWIRWRITDFDVSDQTIVYFDRKGSFYVYDLVNQKEIYLGRNIKSYRLAERFVAFVDQLGRLFAADTESGKLRLIHSDVKQYELSGSSLFYLDAASTLKSYSIQSGREKEVVKKIESFQLNKNYLIYQDPQFNVWMANPRFPRPEILESISGEVSLVNSYLITRGAWGSAEIFDLSKKKFIYASSDIKELSLTNDLMVYSMTFGGLLVRDFQSLQERILGDFHGSWQACGKMIGFQHWGVVVFYDYDRDEKLSLGAGLFDFAVGRGGIGYRVGPSELKYYDSTSGEVISISGQVSAFKILNGSKPSMVVHVPPGPRKEKFQFLHQTGD